MKSNYLYKFALWTSILGILAFIFDFGFSHSILEQQIVDGLYFFVIGIGLFSTFTRYRTQPHLLKKKVIIFDSLSIIYTLYVFYMYIFTGEAFRTDLVLANPTWVIWAVILSFIREISEVKFSLNRAFLNPAQLLILSFISIILLGTFLLMLPKATYTGIGFIDAFFTSTSAVCITGLIVVDTATHFTTFGQSIILFLIQIGGLGILTFASYFNYFFSGNSTYENHLTLNELTGSQKLGEVFQVLKNIILITIFIESISAVLIFFSISAQPLEFSEKVFFSVFHSISAFCNAGFSILSDGLYDVNYRYNYPLLLILSFTLVLGGLGFSIVSNSLLYIKHYFLNLFKINTHKKHKPWILNINSRITLTTTFILIILGIISFLCLEYHNTLAKHQHFLGKLTTSIFGATVPRTAGFNSIDMEQLSRPTVLLIIFLMWIGASPSSTGGGIKTSTFAIVILNALSSIRRKNRIDVFRREISEASIKKAFTVVSLSLFVITIGIFLLCIFEPQKDFLSIVFECVSAYSTVGLSLGITSDLSSHSKLVLIIIMFIGRVSMFSIMIAIFKKVKHKNYRYPSEEITIN